MKKLYNEVLHNLYSSFNTVRMNKSRRITWVEHVAVTETGKCMTGKRKIGCEEQ
jgi:hypothetical protein